MERRYFEQRKGRVEIIPMIDIMPFLLVFFIMKDMWVPRRFEWDLFGRFLSLLSVCRPWCLRRKGSPRHQLTWRPQSMSLRRQRSAPMLNVEATGSMLIDPIGAGSTRPPTSTVTPPYYPPKTSKNRYLP